MTMREEKVEFYSEGDPLVGTLRRPRSGSGPWPAVVQGPGWLGLRDAALYRPYHEAFATAGVAVLIVDHRGFGESGGDAAALRPAGQLEDLVNAVTFLETRDDIDADRIGAFGSGGTGGGNAVMLAAHDARIRCAISQVPVADGADWLRRMRREHEWQTFLDRLAKDRRRRVNTGSGEMVHPREEIMVPTPERRAAAVKKDVDDRVPTSVTLASAERVMAYRPIDAAPRARNLMVVAVEGDSVTPTDHALALYEAAPEPKRLIMQRQTTHYAAYAQHGAVVIPAMVEWLRTHLAARSVEAIDASGVTILKEQP